MRSLLLTLPVKLQVLLVAVSTVTIAFVVALICSTFFDVNQLKANTDLISSVYQVMGTVYAILLTFTLWGVWQNYTVAHNTVQTEANSLLGLAHMVEASPRWLMYKIHDAVLIYSKWVVAHEWQALKKITTNYIDIRDQSHISSVEVTHAVQSIVPEGERELVIFAETLTLLNNWLDARRIRILIAQGNSAKALWPLLMTGAFVLFAFHGLFVAETMEIWSALLAGTSLVIGLTFYLIFTLDSPFSGFPSVDSEPFSLLITVIEREMLKHVVPIETLGSTSANVTPDWS